MNREEAIKWLKHCAETHCDDCSYEIQPIEWCSEKMAYCVSVLEEALSAEESVTLYATPKATYIRPLTEEIAIEFLQDSGWLPNHDKEIGNPSMLVRCKDCRYYNNDYMGKWCGRHQAPVWVKEDDFCSWAKMKGGTE